MRFRSVMLLGLVGVLGCPRPDAPPPADEEPLAEEVVDYPDPGAAAFVLAQPAAARWSVREVGGLPPYFEAAGWGPGDSIWGLSRNTPVLAHSGAGGGLREVTGVAWGAAPSPDGRLLAWTSDRGLLLGGGAQPPSVLLHAGDAHPGSEGGPPAELHWSPTGDRILAGWGLEWDAVHTVVGVPSGSARHIRSSIDGYFLRDARLWLDDSRVLFATRAVRSLAGEQEYGPGYRADLAVLTLGDDDYELVTRVADGVFLDPAGRLPDGSVLVTELDVDARVTRHWTYDPATWESRPFPAPPGRAYPDATTGRVLIIHDLGVDRVEESGGRFGLDLVDADGQVVRLGGARGDIVRVFWAREGRRLVIAADYRVFVVEPR
jgi:hypothetical protein